MLELAGIILDLTGSRFETLLAREMQNPTSTLFV